METLKNSICGISLLLASYAGVVVAQEPTESQPGNTADRAIEEIVVLGKPALSYGAHLRRVERELIAIFNANNDSPAFHINCRKISHTGSHIKQRICEPIFLSTSSFRRTQHHWKASNYLIAVVTRLHNNKDSNDAFSKKVAALIGSNDAFNDKVTEYADLVWNTGFSYSFLSSDS